MTARSRILVSWCMDQNENGFWSGWRFENGNRHLVAASVGYDFVREHVEFDRAATLAEPMYVELKPVCLEHRFAVPRWDWGWLRATGARCAVSRVLGVQAGLFIGGSTHGALEGRTTAIVLWLIGMAFLVGSFAAMVGAHD